MAGKRTQRSVWDVQMLQAIARRLNAPFDLVFAAYEQEMRYRIRQAAAEAETARNLLAAMQTTQEHPTMGWHRLAQEGGDPDA